MACVFAAVMCHAPVVVPAVGRVRSASCARTTRGMREVARRLVDARPDRVVVISPHSPRRATRFGAWIGPHRGDLATFGAPGVAVSLPDAPEVADRLGLPSILTDGDLDHGAVVPLSFLVEAGWDGPTAILSVPWEPADPEALGRELAALPGRTAILASGDLSHRLTPDAPAGWHPQAADFDRAVVQCLTTGCWEDLHRLPRREDAGEDVVEATRVAMGAAGSGSADVISYEGPFGVGYLTAVLREEAPPLYAVVRQALRAHLDGRAYTPPACGPSAPSFLGLRWKGELRGSAAELTATDGLGRALARLAIAAATHPDFEPVTRDQLDDLDVEVTVLERSDAQNAGCLVISGDRHGISWPGAAADPLAAALAHGDIPSAAPREVQRFAVRCDRRP